MKRKQHGKPSPKHDKGRSNASAEAKESAQREVADRRRKDGKTKGSLVMGQVTLLRRGESLSSLASEIPKSPESKEVFTKKIRLVAMPPVDIYAGTAFISSPSPRSLPQPTFFNKMDDAGSSEDGATRLLKRVLRLE